MWPFAISSPVTPECQQPKKQAQSTIEVSLRRPTLDDLPAMFEIGADPVACEMAGVKPRTREVFMARWKDVLADPAINSRVIEVSRAGADRPEFAGSISVFQAPEETRDSIGYWIARPHWGKGIASRALEMFLKEEPRRPLHATASVANRASLRVLERHGFRVVGSRMGEETDRYMAREVGEFVLETGGHDLAQTMAVLERTPGVLVALLRGTPAAWTQRNYGEGTWCAYEVVGHLIAAERDDWMARLRRILEHGESRPFDPFGHDLTVKPDSGVAMEKLLDEFAGMRRANLREVAAMNLTPVVQGRTGTHPALGRVTAAQLLATWAVHDLHHIRQACLAMAWQYREKVGPWRAYLNTLKR